MEDLNLLEPHHHTFIRQKKIKSKCQLGAVSASLKTFSERTTKQRKICPECPGNVSKLRLMMHLSLSNLELMILLG